MYKSSLISSPLKTLIDLVPYGFNADNKQTNIDHANKNIASSNFERELSMFFQGCACLSGKIKTI